jgi:hypothetical protein
VNPLEALGWVLVAALAAFGLMAVLFVAVGLIVSIRKHWQLPKPIAASPRADAYGILRCNAVGPDGLRCDRTPKHESTHGATAGDGTWLERW